MSDRINGRFARNFRRVLVSLLATAIAGASPLAAVSAGSAQAQMQRVKFHPGHKTSQVRVPVGKSENIRTNTSFLDIVVGDPEVADVMPLTDRTLSVLGRKIGLTRISVYGEGKVLVGVFDIEVSHDTQQIAAAIRAQFPEAKVRVSTVNGRILLAGLVTDGIMLDRIMTFAKQFSPDVINSMSVAAPQQVML